MSTGAEGPYRYSDETAESLGLFEASEMAAEGRAGDPDPSDRYDDDSTGTVEDYDDWGNDEQSG